MKKVCVVIMILSVSIASGYAQTDADNSRFFVEGDFSVMHQGGTLSLDGVSKKIPSAFAIRLIPKAGYRLNDVFAVGSQFWIEESIEKEMKSDPVNPLEEIEYASKEFGWGFCVFGRYELMKKGKFSFLIDTSIGSSGGNVKEKTGSVEKKTKTIKMIGFSVVPSVAYDLSEKFSLKTTANFLYFGGSFRTVKYENTGETVKTHYIGFDSQSVVLTGIGYVSIGFIYKF